MKDDTIQAIIIAAVLIAICAGFGSCKKWRYDECISVGHSTAYCAADFAGCWKR